MQGKLVRENAILPRFHELRRAWRRLSILGALLTSTSNLARNSPNAEQGCSYTERWPCDVDLLSIVGPWSSVPRTKFRGVWRGRHDFAMRCERGNGVWNGLRSTRRVDPRNLTGPRSRGEVLPSTANHDSASPGDRPPRFWSPRSRVLLDQQADWPHFFYYLPERNPAN